jgi:hypothetical protein
MQDAELDFGDFLDVNAAAGSGGCEASWPSASTEDIGHFKSASAVRDCITDEANTYFQQTAAF